jgi:hypothetical protein
MGEKRIFFYLPTSVLSSTNQVSYLTVYSVKKSSLENFKFVYLLIVVSYPGLGTGSRENFRDSYPL